MSTAAWVLLGALAGAIALAAVLAGGLIWASKEALARSKEMVEASADLSESKVECSDVKQKLGVAVAGLHELEDRLEAEIAARKKAVTIAEEAISDLAKTGDVAGATIRFRSDLNELRALSELPKVQGAAATGSGHRT